ncbi:MAG: hypothetical protein ACYDCN_14090 [Bacteroidia bacterium]
MKYIIILLLLCIPVLFYYAFEYGYNEEDAADQMVQVKNKSCEVDQNGNDSWGHNIDYYEKRRVEFKLIKNLLNGAIFLDIVLIIFLFYLKYKRRSSEH